MHNTENFTNTLREEKIRGALEAARAVSQGRSRILSEELITVAFPLPYTSLEEAHHEMATSLLQHVLLPYL